MTVGIFERYLDLSKDWLRSNRLSCGHVVFLMLGLSNYLLKLVAPM